MFGDILQNLLIQLKQNNRRIHYVEQKDKNTTTKSESVKLQPRNINKSTKNVFELKEKKSNGTGQ